MISPLYTITANIEDRENLFVNNISLYIYIVSFHFSNECLKKSIEPLYMGWACPCGLWLWTLMRRKAHARNCNHFYIISGQDCIIRKG